MTLIHVEHLRKTFTRAVRKSGHLSTLRTFLSRERQHIHAVADVSFQLAAGEMVGYLGPNGAGKSTTMKMLTGILVPSDGHIVVDGRIPHRQRIEHVRRIGVVFGQRSQLWWDLPTIETFELLRHIYRIPEARWQHNLQRFSELLELDVFLHTPVRQLSLGQRMRADLAAALLHEPSILFLDEPTIGLDVVAKEHIRQFLSHINREHGVTVLLTTHDLTDIAYLCPRVILIDHGQVVYDGALAALRERFGRWRTLVVDLDLPDGHSLQAELVLSTHGANVVRSEGRRMWVQFDREIMTAADLMVDIANRYPVRDLTVEEPDIEAMVRGIYQHGVDQPQPAPT
ncbi:MAG: ATP-binding cassette domain-containing protein [Chloroflexi bacterium AL-W]|nr:ATP-binding cassette domain-containing protein [Chloroflexi bacterium AL-N1]NOK67545.1 ATP-binding cassette domain-containing protein [Chloroflexi bacterium AL-N10]NOK75685.1 ATP-binding cassette domain-containing protein [Chloroflexi bacterium AL-N5]NOK82473.1 ATP-binding cassette domain-containing protein [Chloroflexi bacterium AL-W]NOK90318.1 ATP-binding cassette domain-containing protein [Chloroflexi bacterium AL-N15]